MSFNSLNKAELEAVAEFFVVDVEAADEENGPTKKEYIAALASGDEPVTWDQYKDIYLVAKEEGEDKVDNDAPELTEIEEEAEKVDPVDTTGYILLKMDRQNVRYDTHGVSFTKRHPFHLVPPAVAESILSELDGFRIAMPSEVEKYYN